MFHSPGRQQNRSSQEETMVFYAQNRTETRRPHTPMQERLLVTLICSWGRRYRAKYESCYVKIAESFLLSDLLSLRCLKHVRETNIFLHYLGTVNYISKYIRLNNCNQAGKVSVDSKIQCSCATIICALLTKPETEIKYMIIPHFQTHIEKTTRVASLFMQNC